MTASSTPQALLDELRTVGSDLPGLTAEVPASEIWADRRLHYRLVSPLNRRKFTVIVVGTGLAGGGAAAALGELGYLSLIHISEPTRQCCTSRMPSSA